jgi:putative chitinase
MIMIVSVTLSQVLCLAPNARSSYRAAFESGQPLLDRHGISASPLRVAHFMAQVLHECAALTVQFESLNYSAQRLPKVWPSRFKPLGPLDPAQYACNPRKLANVVYGGRLGNTGANDGYTYRGRGLLQLTGKDNYRQATILLRRFHPDAPDLVALPDEVLSTRWCLAIAAAHWGERGCNVRADRDSVHQVTRAINGGQTGLADRIEWLRRARAIWA